MGRARPAVSGTASTRSRCRSSRTARAPERNPRVASGPGMLRTPVLAGPGERDTVQPVDPSTLAGRPWRLAVAAGAGLGVAIATMLLSPHSPGAVGTTT